MPAESGDKPLLYLFLTFSTPVESGARIYYCDLLIICPLYQTFYGYCYLLYLYQARSSIQTSFILHFFGRTILAPLNMVEPCTRLAPDATAHARQVDLSTSQFDWPRADVHLFLQQLQLFPLFWGPNNKMLLLHVENIRISGFLTRF